MTKKEDDFDMLFEELPPKPKVNKKAIVRPSKPLKPLKSPFAGISSQRLLGELVKRHRVHFQVVGFWILLIVVVLINVS